MDENISLKTGLTASRSKAASLGRRRAAVAAAVLLCVYAFSVQTGAAATPDSSGWPALKGHPDFWTGMWEPRYWEAAEPGEKEESPSLTPPYQARLDADKQAAAKGEGGAPPSAECLPPGMPRIMKMNYPYQFAIAPGQIIILVETYMQVRHIYMDGSPDHFTNGDRPFMNGHSTGKWDGDTLVVDTVGIDSSTPLSSAGDSLISVPIHHSDQMHVVERFRLVEPDVMEIQTTVTDPIALTKPWVTVSKLQRISGDLDEYICEQNNKEFIDAQGRQGLRLGD